jgi:FMN reductase
VSVTVVVGNPRPGSRTRHAAELVGYRLTGAQPDAVLDLAEMGADLVDWSSARIAGLKGQVLAADVIVVASPTYKGTFTGLLKLFLDRFGAGELAGRPAVPLMLGGDLRHALAVEVALKPVLVEIGASCPTRGLFLLDSAYDDPTVLDEWAAQAVPQVAAAARGRQQP